MQWLRLRLLGVFWEHSLVLRRPARRLRQALSLLACRLRSRRGQPPRVVVAGPSPTRRIAHPAIAIHLGPETDPDDCDRFLAAQTETSLTRERAESAAASYCFVPAGDLGALPATHLESLLLAAVAEDLEWTSGGWASSTPSPGTDAPWPVLRPAGLLRSALTLLRLPDGGRADGRTVVGRLVPHVTAEAPAGCDQPTASSCPGSGPYLLRPDVRPDTVVRTSVFPVSEALAALPAVPGPRTALFLVPYMAVGGAERQLIALLEHLCGRYRLLVVTLSPHPAALGQTLDACRRLTPHVYTLGDWLPRAARFDALCHLLRRYAVEALVSWNGTVEFFDHPADLRHTFPRLRILSQIYNHEGGWIDHFGPRLRRAVDCHLAVNHRIAAVLAGKLGIERRRIEVIHPSVEVPPPVSEDQRRERRFTARRELGLPADALVAGTFVRLDRQKRPFDVLRLARRLAGRGVHFLLVGGGPLEPAVGRRLAAAPVPNLRRLPFRHDVEVLYDAIDVCLSTSSFEGLPVFLLEGLARAVPCVATAVGDIPLLLREGGGVLVQRPGDLGELERALLALADPERRRAEGRRGRETVARDFSLVRFRERYEAVIFPPP